MNTEQRIVHIDKYIGYGVIFFTESLMISDGAILMLVKLSFSSPFIIFSR